MFGNNKRQPIQEDNESRHQSQMIQQPVQPQERQPVDTSAVSAKINELDSAVENISNYLQEQMGITSQIAQRIEKLEGESTPVLTQMTDSKRLMVIEQNLLSHQVTMEAIVESLTELTTQFNKIVESAEVEGKGKSKKKKVKPVEEYDEEEDEEESEYL